MKTYGRVEVQMHAFLNSALGVEWLTLMTQLLFIQVNSFRLFDDRLSGLQSRSGRYLNSDVKDIEQKYSKR